MQLKEKIPDIDCVEISKTLLQIKESSINRYYDLFSCIWI